MLGFHFLPYTNNVEMPLNSRKLCFLSHSLLKNDIPEFVYCGLENMLFSLVAMLIGIYLKKSTEKEGNKLFNDLLNEIV